MKVNYFALTLGKIMKSMMNIKMNNHIFMKHLMKILKIQDFKIK